MDKRIKLIQQWVEYLAPDKKIIEELESFGWDYEGQPFELKKTHLRNILEKYLKEELTSEQIYEWANFIEMREDVDYKSFEEIIFCLANPEINDELNPEQVKEWIKGLSER